MSWTYRYETKGIQNWILDSNRMRDLAGGSNLIEVLTQTAEQEARKAGAEKIPQATSGSMTAIFPDLKSLEKFASEWPMRVSQLAPGLQLVQAWAPTLREVFEKLAWRRNRVPVNEPEVGPWVLRAGRSGLPAIPRPPEIRSVARKTALDEAALAKELARPKPGVASTPTATGGLDWSRFDQELDTWECPAAVIHADGSGVGQKLIDIGDDPDKLKSFSESLQKATLAATRAAFEDLEEDGRILARPIVSAGDDVTCIVPAGQGRRFATSWLRAFEEQTEEHLGERLQGGAGLAIVHASYPFSSAYEHAEELCKQAKQALKNQGRKASVIAFRRITTSVLEEAGEGGLGWLLESMEALENLVEATRSLPRGSLRNWLTLFEHGEKEAERANQLWQRAREVAQARGGWSEFERALRAVGADPATGVFQGYPHIVRLKDDGRATPLRDALVLRQLEAVKEVANA